MGVSGSGRIRKCSYGIRRGRARQFTMATAGVPQRFCRCACFCSENLYVARYGLHVRFRGEQQLRTDYGPVSGLHRLRRGMRGRAGGGGTFVPEAAGFARVLRSDRHSGSAARCPSFLPLTGDKRSSLVRLSCG